MTKNPIGFDQDNETGLQVCPLGVKSLLGDVSRAPRLSLLKSGRSIFQARLTGTLIVLDMEFLASPALVMLQCWKLSLPRGGKECFCKCCCRLFIIE
jgi:hypothetical protein